MSTFNDGQQYHPDFGQSASPAADSTPPGGYIGQPTAYPPNPYAAAAFDRRPNPSAKLSIGISAAWLLIGSIAPVIFVYASRPHGAEWFSIVSLVVGAAACIAALLIGLQATRQPGSALWSGASVGIAIVELAVLALNALLNYLILPYIVYPLM